MPLVWKEVKGTRYIWARGEHTWVCVSTNRWGDVSVTTWECSVCRTSSTEITNVTSSSPGLSSTPCPGVTTHPAEPLSTHTVNQLRVVGQRPTHPDEPDAAYYHTDDLYIPGYHWAKTIRA